MRPAGRGAARLALTVGLASALVTALWATGHAWLADTVGGMFERAGRSGGLSGKTFLWGVVVVKVVAASLPLLAVRRSGSPSTRRVIRLLTWVEASILTGYGLVLTTVGLLVQANVVRASVHADHRALAWHAYLWDPWFLVWGTFVLVALLGSRQATRDPRRVAEDRPTSPGHRLSHGVMDER